jgi:hypothetical protein
MKFQTTKGDYFHFSETIEFPSTDVDHNWHPIFFQLNLSQRMQGDGNFNYVAHPAEVVIGGNGLTPDGARGLAALLVELADRAEATVSRAST